jgi:hypothetical protein
MLLLPSLPVAARICASVVSLIKHPSTPVIAKKEPIKSVHSKETKTKV